MYKLTWMTTTLWIGKIYSAFNLCHCGASMQYLAALGCVTTRHEWTCIFDNATSPIISLCATYKVWNNTHHISLYIHMKYLSPQCISQHCTPQLNWVTDTFILDFSPLSEQHIWLENWYISTMKFNQIILQSKVQEIKGSSLFQNHAMVYSRLWILFLMAMQPTYKLD